MNVHSTRNGSVNSIINAENHVIHNRSWAYIFASNFKNKRSTKVKHH